MTWLEAAEKYAKLADEARAAGDMVVFVAAIQRAAECVYIAKKLGRPCPSGPVASIG